MNKGTVFDYQLQRCRKIFLKTNEIGYSENESSKNQFPEGFLEKKKKFL